MAAKYYAMGFHEYARSFSNEICKIAAKIDTSINRKRCYPVIGSTCAALDASGKLLDDFVIMEATGMIHVLNAPSPAQLPR